MRHKVSVRARPRAPTGSDTADVEAEYLSDPAHGALFGRLSRVSLLLEEFHTQCFARFGLRFVDYSLLRVLQLADPPYELSPTRLSEVLVRSTGGMTQILDRLERDGLVRRSPDPSDRRKVIVGLTPAGLRLVKKANMVYVARKDQVLGHLDDAELDRIDDVILQLVHLLDAATSEVGSGGA